MSETTPFKKNTVIQNLINLIKTVTAEVSVVTLSIDYNLRTIKMNFYY